MNHFQLTALICLGIVWCVTMYKYAHKRITRFVAFGWSVLWIVAAALIVWPGATMYVARVLGIGRGADLVFYCAILGMCIGFFYVYIKMRRVEDMITKIVRHLALEEE